MTRYVRRTPLFTSFTSKRNRHAGAASGDVRAPPGGRERGGREPRRGGRRRAAARVRTRARTADPRARARARARARPGPGPGPGRRAAVRRAASRASSRSASRRDGYSAAMGNFVFFPTRSVSALSGLVALSLSWVAAALALSFLSVPGRRRAAPPRTTKRSGFVSRGGRWKWMGGWVVRMRSRWRPAGGRVGGLTSASRRAGRGVVTLARPRRPKQVGGWVVWGVVFALSQLPPTTDEAAAPAWLLPWSLPPRRLPIALLPAAFPGVRLPPIFPLSSSASSRSMRLARPAPHPTTPPRLAVRPTTRPPWAILRTILPMAPRLRRTARGSVVSSTQAPRTAPRDGLEQLHAPQAPTAAAQARARARARAGARARAQAGAGRRGVVRRAARGAALRVARDGYSRSWLASDGADALRRTARGCVVSPQAPRTALRNGLEQLPAPRARARAQARVRARALRRGARVVSPPSLSSFVLARRALALRHERGRRRVRARGGARESDRDVPVDS